MPYTPDATDVANPVAGTVKAATAAAEFIAIKLYIRDVLLAGLNLKAPLASPVLSGNVGIGTGGNPYYHHLSVYSGGATANYVQLANGNTGLAAANGLLLGVDATGNAVINQQSSFNLLVNVAGVERMLIDSAGNVGIGTTPASKFHGVGTSTYPYLIWDSNASSTPSVIQHRVNASAGWEVGMGNLADSYRYMICYGSHGMANAKFTVTSSGSVAVGTASPSASAILDIQSTTQGLRLPNMTTAQKNAIAYPAAGLMVFDTTLSRPCFYSGAAWVTL